MVRFSGATVLLIFLIAVVSVYTCAVVLGRTLESSKRSPAAAVTRKLQLLFGFSSTKIAVSYTHNRRHTTTEEQPSSSLSPSSTVVMSSLGGASFFVSRAYGQQMRKQDGNESFSGEIVAATKVGPWGGSGGQPFYMRTGGGTVRLRSVTLYHSDAIHAFSYDYIDLPFTRRAYHRRRGDVRYGQREHTRTLW
ncbi:uncharacterized protein LOC112268840 [Brachypodium distachyon]|uniref:uncharacterized protein LOC112268840 n=1 Tax=Brachypodium distachyon TaxID=15368 RepID=UPI000D0CEEDF|nr:uncharacterized protein LOC112268840 [Brachypodium distachyon]|eukprot:XP_024310782.1 uncharacterized protein LOC112268840 [Brachypodium distachyon]